MAGTFNYWSIVVSHHEVAPQSHAAATAVTNCITEQPQKVSSTGMIDDQISSEIYAS